MANLVYTADDKLGAMIPNPEIQKGLKVCRTYKKFVTCLFFFAPEIYFERVKQICSHFTSTLFQEKPLSNAFDKSIAQMCGR